MTHSADWGLVLRLVLGWAAILIAGAQFSMRYIIAEKIGGRLERRKEFLGSVAGLFLLGGVGIGNLTHLHAPAALSTVLISLGVVCSAWLVEATWRITQPNGK